MNLLRVGEKARNTEARLNPTVQKSGSRHKTSLQY